MESRIMTEKIIYILFGAGVYAKKYKAILEYLHMDFDYFTDTFHSEYQRIYLTQNTDIKRIK